MKSESTLNDKSKLAQSLSPTRLFEELQMQGGYDLKRSTLDALSFQKLMDLEQKTQSLIQKSR